MINVPRIPRLVLAVLVLAGAVAMVPAVRAAGAHFCSATNSYYDSFEACSQNCFVTCTTETQAPPVTGQPVTAPSGSGAVLVPGGSSVNIAAPSPLGALDLNQAIAKVIRGVWGLTGVAVFLMFVYAGFVVMTAQGSSARIETAKKTMVWAVIGLFGILTSYAIMNFVVRTLER